MQVYLHNNCVLEIVFVAKGVSCSYLLFMVHEHGMVETYMGTDGMNLC